MVINPPLILVSALFFLALVSALYLTAWLGTSLVLRLGRARLSHAATKRVLMAALVAPPLLAALPTLGGATLRHSHVRESAEHHSMACRQMFAHLLVGPGTGGAASEVSGLLVNGAAWLLLGIGMFLVARLVRATVQLEGGLENCLSAPSPRLAASLARVAPRLPGLPAERFFECAIPAAYSSVLGLRRIRCVLSSQFVVEASPEELDAVVAHEASHLRARDVPATFVLAVLSCLFFSLRPVRLLVRRWREEAELACDDAAVAATCRPLAMAAAILRARGAPIHPAGPASGPGRPLPIVVMPFADEAACPPGKRVERLLSQARHAALPSARESLFQLWGAWTATLLLGATGVALLLSPGMICYAHCSLEAVARLLP